jgi:hypothetical protein
MGKALKGQNTYFQRPGGLGTGQKARGAELQEQKAQGVRPQRSKHRGEGPKW